jgi:hypothetical protein
MTPLVNVTQPMVFTHSIETNPFVFSSGTANRDTQPIPWASNPFSFCIPDMSLHFPSSVLSSYVNPSFGSRSMMHPYSPFSFGGSHIPQPNLMVGGWNPPSSRPNPSFSFPRSSAQMGGPSTYYISSIYPSFAMLVPTHTFLMADLLLSSGVSSRGSQFYSMGNALHGVPSSGGNIYPHLSNPCHVAFSSQEVSLVMMPLQPFMNQFEGGYHPIEHGHGVYHNLSCPAISQNQSFPEPWSQMPQPVVVSHVGSTSPVTASHISHTSPTSTGDVGDSSPTSASHVGDRSTTFASHVEDQQPTITCHVGGTTLVTASHTAHTSATSASHVGDSSPTYPSHVGVSSITFASHVEDKLLASGSHVEDKLLASASHVGSMSPTTEVMLGTLI